MDDHRTLEDFLEGAGRGDADEDGPEDDAHDGNEPGDDTETNEPDEQDEPNEGETEVDHDPPNAVDPTMGTYRWSPEAVSCESCGTAVRRRWRDGDRFVCVECKVW